MGQILRNWRIFTAAVFSLFLVGGAYLLTRGIGSPPMAEASAETALLQAIASKDSDNDGLPDWQEALYGTDPQNPDSFKLGMTDGAAVAKGLIVPKAIADVPNTTSTQSTKSNIDYAAMGLTAPTENTLTDAFAKNFFSLYASMKQAKGGGALSADETSALASQALSSLTSTVTTAPDFKSQNDLTVGASGADALRDFAVDAEHVFRKNTSTATTSELIYLEYALESSDTTALKNLVAIAKNFRDSAAGLAALPVPQELSAQDLALINAMMRVSEIINDFSRVNSDPLTAMIALQQYLPAAQALGQAFVDVRSVYSENGVIIQNGTPGASFVNLAANAVAKASGKSI